MCQAVFFEIGLVSFELAIVVLNLPKKCTSAHQCQLKAFNDFRFSLSHWNLRDGEFLWHLSLQRMCNQVFDEAAKTVSHVAHKLSYHLSLHLRFDNANTTSNCLIPNL